MNNSNIATVRTAVNTTLLAAVATLLYKLFGWTIEVEDMLPFLPVIAVITAVFYRLSLLASERWPWIGYVLFGIPKKPVYLQPPSDELDRPK